MSKKSAFVLEWVGAGIILLGAAIFLVIYIKRIQVVPIHRSILLWVLGFGMLCYIPKSLILYEERKQLAAEEKIAEKQTAAEKSANSLRRSIIIRFICGMTLILYGLKIVLIG